MKHFTMAELTNSATAKAKGLDNTPTPEHIDNIFEFVENLLDPLREAWAHHCKDGNLGSPALNITSGYRGFRLNEEVGGSETSAHCFGYAADIVPANRELSVFKNFCRKWLRKYHIQFDQMISEKEDAYGTPRWIHIGYKNRAGKQRKQFLSYQYGEYKPMA